MRIRNNLFALRRLLTDTVARREDRQSDLSADRRTGFATVISPTQSQLARPSPLLDRVFLATVKRIVEEEDGAGDAGGLADAPA